jgi:hypothetical protein
VFFLAPRYFLWGNWVVILSHSIHAFAVFTADRIYGLEFISSELRGFAPSRETVFCAKLQRVQEKIELKLAHTE